MFAADSWQIHADQKIIGPQINKKIRDQNSRCLAASPAWRLAILKLLSYHVTQLPNDLIRAYSRNSRPSF
jgi:hypothetical protein